MRFLNSCIKAVILFKFYLVQDYCCCVENQILFHHLNPKAGTISIAPSLFK